jgi:hypothetical protein
VTRIENDPVRRKFDAALDALVEEIQQDRSILAAILCGSLSHDTVWAQSDIDLALVTVDDRKIPGGHTSLYADGLNVHAMLIPRTQFRATVEGSLHNSFMHSLLAKGRLLYTHDQTVADLCARLQDLGERDRRIQLLSAATQALPCISKAHKWFVTRGDLDYTALWLLYAGTSLAQVEVIGAGLLADREVLPQALTLNPSFFAIVYTNLLNGRKTTKDVKAALAAVDAYVAERAPALFAPILDHLREAGEARSATEIEDYCKRHFGIEGATTACEYLADQGLIGKVSIATRLTRLSRVDVQELAFVHHEPSR